MKPLPSDNGPALPRIVTSKADNEAVDNTDVDGEREPDYRMSLAAERTYLAYLRTGLALLAAGVAVVGALPDAGAQLLRRCVGLVLVGVGGTVLAAVVVRSLGLVLVLAAVAAGVVVLVL
ncbi:MAG: putative rane protein [Pseudonocardiales bacterium]|nr:putative rane protein [Pseudonocardiales bacterium]